MMLFQGREVVCDFVSLPYCTKYGYYCVQRIQNPKGLDYKQSYIQVNNMLGFFLPLVHIPFYKATSAKRKIKNWRINCGQMCMHLIL